MKSFQKAEACLKTERNVQSLFHKSNIMLYGRRKDMNNISLFENSQICLNMIFIFIAIIIILTIIFIVVIVKMKKSVKYKSESNNYVNKMNKKNSLHSLLKWREIFNGKI